MIVMSISTIPQLKAHAHFRAYQLTPSGVDYGLTANKHVKQCWVRITENGVVAQDYSSIAASTSDSAEYSAEATQLNNPLYTQTFNHGWLYF
jgi:hypothetical protein